MSSSSVVLYNKQKQVPTSPAIDNKNDIVDPLDFSFCKITKVEEICDEEPRISSPRKIKPVIPESGKSASRCLRLNNNSMLDMCGLPNTIQTLFDNPSNVAWIDLSFNEISKIDPSICECENIQILYLHGNIIGDLKSVEILTGLSSLRKLTLHGNPLEKEKGYRQQILSILPNLQELDFSCVTKGDRKNAETWKKLKCGGGKRKKQKHEDND